MRKIILIVFLVSVVFVGLGNTADWEEYVCEEYSHKLMRLYEEEDSCYHATMFDPSISYNDCVNESSSQEIKELQEEIAKLKCEHNPSIVEKHGTIIAIAGIPIAKEVLERILDL